MAGRGEKPMEHARTPTLPSIPLSGNFHMPDLLQRKPCSLRVLPVLILSEDKTLPKH